MKLNANIKLLKIATCLAMVSGAFCSNISWIPYDSVMPKSSYSMAAEFRNYSIHDDALPDFEHDVMSPVPFLEDVKNGIYSAFGSNTSDIDTLAINAKELLMLIDNIKFYNKELEQLSKKLIRNLNAIKVLTTSENIIKERFRGDKKAYTAMLQYIKYNTEIGQKSFYEYKKQLENYALQCKLLRDHIMTLSEKYNTNNEIITKLSKIEIKTPICDEYYTALQASGIETLPITENIEKTEAFLKKVVEEEYDYNNSMLNKRNKDRYHLICNNK